MDSLLQCIVKEITWPYTTLSVVALDSSYYPGPIPKGRCDRNTALRTKVESMTSPAAKSC